MEDAISLHSPSNDYQKNCIAQCFNWTGTIAKTVPEGLEGVIQTGKFKYGGVILIKTKHKIDEEDIYFLQYNDILLSIDNARKLFSERFLYIDCDLISEIIVIDFGFPVYSKEKYYFISEIYKNIGSGSIMDYYVDDYTSLEEGRVGFSMIYIKTILPFLMRGW